MELWQIGGLAVVLLLIERAVLHLSNIFVMCKYQDCTIDENSKPMRIIVSVLVVLFMVFVEGTFAGSYLGYWLGKTTDVLFCLDGVLICVALFAAGYFVLGLYKFKNILYVIGFFIVFIVATFFWTNYYHNYYSNIEEEIQTRVVSEQDNDLVFLNDIPLMEMSYTPAEKTDSGEEDDYTDDVITFWCINENNEGVFYKAPVVNSKIVPITEAQKPFVRITTYRMVTVENNHNNGRVTEKTSIEWNEYVFYLPAEIMVYIGG